MTGGEQAQTCDNSGDPTRKRIIDATFHLLMERGYTGATTSEIARRARVSKRELYALFDSKDGILAAMIAGRAVRMRQPLVLPEVADRNQLAQTMTRFGISLLREGCDPAVTTVIRLAIAEAERAPDLARHLDEAGRRPTRAALVGLLTRAAECGLIDCADPGSMASQFLALLWGDLQMALLLRVAEPPSAEACERRAQVATTALLKLYPERLNPAG